MPDEAWSILFSGPRAHTQRAAFEFRFAVREYFQRVPREGKQSAPRNCLADLYCTQCDMLDDQILSEDKEESDMCIQSDQAVHPLHKG